MRKCFDTSAAVFSFGLLAAFLVSGALAHHSARITYDTDRIIEVEGEITRIVWRNPHVRFTLNALDENQEMTVWEVESTPVSRLSRVGITPDILHLGDTVRVAGHPARRPVREVYAINLLLSDGREALLDTPVARWTDDTIGTGTDAASSAASADASLGIFRVWGNDGSILRAETRFLTEGGTLNYPLTEAARAARAAWDPLALDNPFLGCGPRGMPSIMQQPLPIEFTDNGGEIVLHMELFDTVRVISMVEDAPGPPTLLGYSTGRWEGETLVVTTKGIGWPHFDQHGLRQSEAVEMLERFTVNETGSRLDYELVVTDPWLFTEPVTLRRSWKWVPGDRVLPFDCTED